MKCKCSRLRKRLSLYDERTLPDDLRAALENCPSCRRFFEQHQMVRQLLALKNCESPPDYGSRCVENVHRRLAALLEEEKKGALTDWRDIWLGPVPAFRVGVAALFLVFLGLHMLSSAPRPLTQWVPQPEPRTAHERRLESPSPPFRAADMRLLYEQGDFTTASNGRPIEVIRRPPSYFQLINLEP